MSEAKAAEIAKELGPNVQHVFLDATEEESIAEAVTAAAVRQTTTNRSVPLQRVSIRIHARPVM